MSVSLREDYARYLWTQGLVEAIANTVKNAIEYETLRAKEKERIGPLIVIKEFFRDVEIILDKYVKWKCFENYNRYLDFLPEPELINELKFKFSIQG